MKLCHESCKCVCKLNSLVCNNKQIWNDDTCRCDCNEDFAGIINCTKGYTWNPSTCECQCDMWCKPDNNKDNNFYKIMVYVFIGLFFISLVICFCAFIYFKCIQDKKLFKNKYINY